MKQKGPIEKEDPNAVRKKLSPKALEQIEKKASEDSGKGKFLADLLRLHCLSQTRTRVAENWKKTL